MEQKRQIKEKYNEWKIQRIFRLLENNITNFDEFKKDGNVAYIHHSDNERTPKILFQLNIKRLELFFPYRISIPEEIKQMKNLKELLLISQVSRDKKQLMGAKYLKELRSLKYIETNIDIVEFAKLRSILPNTQLKHL